MTTNVGIAVTNELAYFITFNDFDFWLYELVYFITFYDFDF